MTIFNKFIFKSMQNIYDIIVYLGYFNGFWILK